MTNDVAPRVSLPRALSAGLTVSTTLSTLHRAQHLIGVSHAQPAGQLLAVAHPGGPVTDGGHHGAEARRPLTLPSTVLRSNLAKVVRMANSNRGRRERIKA